MLGMKKNKNTDGATDTNSPVVKKKKAKERMSSVLEESVVENILDDIKSCSEFKIGDKFLAVKLHADDIGGINKVTKKNEVIGSIIEAIRSSRIKSIITKDLLDSDCLVIILDRETVDTMNEFELLINVDYDVVYLSENGSIEDTEDKIKFADILAVSSGSKSINEVLNPKADTSEDTLVDTDDEQSLSESNEEEDLVPEYDDVVPEYEDEVEPIDNYEEPTVYDDTPEEEVVYNDYSEDYIEDDIEDAYEDELVDDGGVLREKTQEEIERESEEVIISEELQSATINRVLNKGDLDLEIDPSVFDSYFVDMRDPILFSQDKPDGDSLLDSEVYELRQLANVQISELHQRNISKARTMFMNLISFHAETITNKYSYNNPSYWGSSVKKSIEEKKKNDISNMKSLVFEKQKSAKEDWEKELNAVGERGRQDAIKRYIDENKTRFDAKLEEIENGVLTSIEYEASSYIKSIEDERKREAIAAMEAGITRIMELVLNNYIELQNEERLLYQQLSMNIKDFISSNRANEQDRIRVLDTQQRQQTEAERVRIDLENNLRSTIESYEAKLESKFNEMEELRARHLDDLKHKDIITETQAKDYALKISHLEEKNAEYIDRLANLDKEKEEKYKFEMDQLKGQLNAENEKIIYMEKRERKLSILIVGIAIIGMLTAGLGGYIVGTSSVTKSTTNTNNTNQQQQPPYVIERWHSEEKNIDNNSNNSNGDVTTNSSTEKK